LLRPDEKKTLREVVASAVAAGMTNDHVAALAFSDRLGAVLLRLKYANDASSYQPALQLVVKRMRRRQAEGRALLERIAARALHEYLDELCGRCSGRGMVYAAEQPVHVCPYCEGTGRKRHRDADRARALGVPLERYPKLASRLQRALSTIYDADAYAARDIAAQLSRGRSAQTPCTTVQPC
jgi:hypothetical protein